ncbi:hypothetical protein KCU88_g5807, partial [Aureobasidium melanogenum]
MDSQHLPRTKSILVIGFGELGSAILHALQSHRLYSPEENSISVLVRPSTLSNPSPQKASQLAKFQAEGITLVPGDIEGSEDGLVTLLKSYTSVIHAGGMNLPAGSLLKLTRAVLAAGVQYYIPWQHGVDYDVIGREGGQGMFSEQIDVRDCLRAQNSTAWVVISCGIFTSFLFEDFWGVVKNLPDNKVQVTALNSWQDVVTTTAAEDIATCTAELLLCADTPVNGPVYIAGDTLTYEEFADVVGQSLRREVVKKVWPLEYLREESLKDPADKLKRYRVVFAEGKGLSWPKETTWNAQRGLKLMGVEDWIRKNLA